MSPATRETRGTGPHAAELATAASAVLDPVFARLKHVAATVVTTRPPGGEGWSATHLEPVTTLLVELVRHSILIAGMGFVAAPGAIDGQDRYIEWWQRRAGHTARLRLNFDPESIDLYDYLQMEWFQLPQQGMERVAFGPYVDYSGSELYTVTATVPVNFEGEFLGVAGVDLVVSELERRLLTVLRSAPLDAVIVSAERRVIATNTPRWVVGSRLAALPEIGRTDGGDRFVEVVTVPTGTGWVLALAVPEEPTTS